MHCAYRCTGWKLLLVWPLPELPHHAQPCLAMHVVRLNRPSSVHSGQHSPDGITSLDGVSHVTPVATHLLSAEHHWHSSSTVHAPQLAKELQ